MFTNNVQEKALHLLLVLLFTNNITTTGIISVLVARPETHSSGRSQGNSRNVTVMIVYCTILVRIMLVMIIVMMIIAVMVSEVTVMGVAAVIIVKRGVGAPLLITRCTPPQTCISDVNLCIRRLVR